MTNASHAELTGITDAAVNKATGHDWQRWVELLDAVGSTTKSHPEIAAYVHQTFEVSSWWAQMITVGYERICGLRDTGQRRDGSFEANKSKTLDAPLAEAYEAFVDEAVRERWLPGLEWMIRKATRNKSIRITWPDGTWVSVNFTPKGESRCQVAIQHGRLESQEQIAERKAFWSESLAELARVLAPRP